MSLYWTYSQDEEAQRWREHQREVWAEATRLEQESIEDARRAHEQWEYEKAMGELEQIVYLYLMDEMTEEYACINMVNLGFDSADLEKLALEMIDTLDESKPDEPA